ncbi:hypothetical protein DY931_32630 [Pseudomonas aeruginosa]|uniref:hypothetical protein n=1 Tax=Pseudomonas aeruginosa TaxID=287 RepID=UPI000F846390|nr:hypothetical protein [Pseudomonas aeruginosa]RTR53924.1 hypothetical protein DY931_32630 [Pseudomonas aeruginosa]
MAKRDLLERAYKALAELTIANLGKISIAEISRTSGVGRATINQKNDSAWVAFREAVGAHNREFSAADTDQTKLSANHIAKRISDLEFRLGLLREKANISHGQLIDKIQYYYTLSKDRPNLLADKAKLLNENSQLRSINRNLRSELDVATAQTRATVNLKPINSKRLIDLAPDLPSSEIVASLIKESDKLCALVDPAAVTQTFMMFGYHKSGSEEWITSHSSHASGVALYINAPFWDSSTRKTATAFLKSKFKCAIHCVRLLTSYDVCATRITHQYNGAIQARYLEALETAHSNLEEVSLSEEFSSIIMVKPDE